MEKDRPGKSSHTVTACCRDSIERRSNGFAEKSSDGWFEGREGGARWSSVSHSQGPRVKPRYGVTLREQLDQLSVTGSLARAAT